MLKVAPKQSGITTRDAQERKPSEEAAHQEVIGNHEMETDELHRFHHNDLQQFGQKSASEKLKFCKNCNRSITGSHYTQHLERCLKASPRGEDEVHVDTDSAAMAVPVAKPPRKSRRRTRDGASGRGDSAGTHSRALKRTQEGQGRGSVEGEKGEGQVNKSQLALPETQGLEGSSLFKRITEASPTSPLLAEELDVCCGVVSDKTGAPCRRPITCSFHTDSSKRSVQGRRRLYATLIEEWQQKTPNGGHFSFLQGPVPLATKQYRATKRHIMRNIVGSMFRGTCESSVPLPLQQNVLDLQPTITIPLPVSPLPLFSSSPSGTSARPVATPAVEVKKPSKARPKKTAVVPIPLPELPLSPNLGAPIHSYQQQQQQQPLEALEGSPGQRAKPKAKPKIVKEGKHQLHQQVLPPQIHPPGLASPALTPKSKGSKSIKQQKAMQRMKQEELQKKQQQSLMMQQQQQQQLDFGHLQQQQRQTLDPTLQFVTDPQSSIMQRTHSFSQMQLPQAAGALHVHPMSSLHGFSGQLQSEGMSVLQTGQPFDVINPHSQIVDTLAMQQPTAMMEIGSGIGVQKQDANPLQRLLVGGLPQTVAPPPIANVGFSQGVLSPPVDPQLQIPTPSGAAMFAGSSSDWGGALP